MPSVIGIRREDKNIWERRVPLTPEDVKCLVEKGVDLVIQPSGNRAFTDEEYRLAGARLEENLSNCQIMLAIKEIPKEYFMKGNTYVFFSHTIKGQEHNMPMLRTLLDLKCQLIDYERVVDDKNRRLIFFGKYAGLAGMIDSRSRRNSISEPFWPWRSWSYGSLESICEGSGAAFSGGPTASTTPGKPWVIVPLCF